MFVAADQVIAVPLLAVIVIDNEAVAVFPAESVTVTPNDAAVAVDGVPLITPVEEARLSPEGNAPELMDQV
jgi:hypothetical protein